MKGKIVLVPFPFTDLTATKLRPALVLFENGTDVVLAFISSKIPVYLSLSDVPLTKQHPGFRAAGLKVDSVIKLDKIATVLAKLVVAELGELDADLKSAVNEKTRTLYIL